MLIVKVYVNDEQIDELQIGRTEDFKGEDKIHEYKICKPELIKSSPFLLHRYCEGYKRLLHRAIDKIMDDERLQKGLPIYNGGGK